MNKADWEKELATGLPVPERRLRANVRQVKERIRMGQKEGNRAKVIRTAIGVLLVIIIAAMLVPASGFRQFAQDWLTGPNKRTVAVKQHEPVTLKVVTVGDDGYFNRRYGRLLMLNNDWLTLDVKMIAPTAEDVSNHFQDLIRKVKAEKPDLVLLYEPEYADFVKSGALAPLDDLVKRDQFDLNGFHSAVTGILRANGEGKLYGLSPFIASQALFYNKDLFDQYGVPYPKEKSTWPELLELARKFPASAQEGSELIGLHVESAWRAFDLVSAIAETGGLKQALLNGSLDKTGWKAAWSMVLDRYESGYIRPMNRMQAGKSYSQEEFLQLNKFLTGNAAMSVGDYLQYIQLQGMEDYGLKSFRLGVTTAPVDPKYPDEGTFYKLQDIFAIPSDADQPEEAWNTIKQLHSLEGEQMLVRAAGGQSTDLALPSRPAALLDEREDLGTFYALRWRNFPDPAQSLLAGMTKLGNDEAEAVLAGKKTASEAADAFLHGMEQAVGGKGK